MSTRTVKEALTAAKILISSPEKWTQNAMARDASGSVVVATNKTAVCFCALGALHRTLLSFSKEWRQARSALSVGMGVRPDLVTQFNDSHTHSEVMAAFDRAIETAK